MILLLSLLKAGYPMIKRWLERRKYQKQISVARAVPPELVGKRVHPAYQGGAWLTPLSCMAVYLRIEEGIIPAGWDIAEADPDRAFTIIAGVPRA